MKVFAYIARRYNSAAEAISLLSSVAALANSCFVLPVRKRSVELVSERVKLVYSIKNTRLAFQTYKTKSNRPQTSELKSIPKFQLLFHWKNFEKYMIFYTMP